MFQSGNLTLEKREKAVWFYMILLAMFLTSLIVCNIITAKFVSIDLGFKEFVLPAGILVYPITFLVTDILSEIYGRKRANLAVTVGFVASIFTMLILYLGKVAPAIDSSIVSDEVYNMVFGNSARAILASMIAYLIAQYIDVRVYHFWKDLTKGKHLWLRNNASTIFSQFIDSFLVIMVLFYGVEEFNTLMIWVLNAWLFKLLCALVDTPFIYLIVFGLRKYFKLEINEEIEF